ncbi:DUF2268 domain-containing putative Zn-dependent protease [Alteribacter natronophilus]|uniref:DUF2268 domain-containing putative Zn-dependent protease n=1 Tax=Alteribacter natronophilus TaxID=2583810 RepID=UPI00110E620D|nr:DUF2268 domain-containing putative Zn-dependent protease [Alteribacter natronophilus]TMW72854.1 hypothetical protein FGB90_00635 [Alteribacter natronophilus]
MADDVQCINMVPKFLDFYERAKEADPESRWKLWQKHYGFAAVQPGEEGQKMARELLDGAWEKYGEKIDHLRSWKPELEDLKQTLTEVKTLLGCGEQVSFTVIYFAGGFEGNAFAAQLDENRMALCLPVENGTDRVTLVHELTHIVHSHTAGLSGEWERTIGTTVIQEGLATHASRVLVPGQNEEDYVELEPGWLNSCRENRSAILNGIVPCLHDASGETVTRFTFGKGTTGHAREAYFAGWEVVFYLLEQGKSLAEVAAIQEKDLPDFTGRVLWEMTGNVKMQ